MSWKPPIEMPRRRLAAFCRRHPIRRLALFGSILRDDFGPDSDVDVLVEFEAGKVPGLSFFVLDEELGTLWGCKVDLNTPGCFRPPLREKMLDQARVVYERRRRP
jgi:predicted nucleotidyltransferase